MTDEQIELVRKQFEEIAKIKYQIIEEIKFEDLDFNPFILKLMNLKTADEIAEFMISQRVERSLFTTYGHRIQKIAKDISQTPKGTASSEVIKEKNGRKNHIYMKAGPNTVNKGISEEVNAAGEKTKAHDPDAQIFLGMTYGRRGRVNTIIHRYAH